MASIADVNEEESERIVPDRIVDADLDETVAVDLFFQSENSSPSVIGTGCTEMGWWKM